MPPGRWTRFVLLALFAMLLAYGWWELARVFGWIAGGEPVLRTVRIDLWRGVAAVVVGTVGVLVWLGALSSYWLSAPARLVGGPLQTERQSDGRRVLTRDLTLEIDGQTLTVPTGTITDFSSIPSVGRVLVRWSRVDVAGVVHDWLYQQGKPNRRQADLIWWQVALSGDHRANAFQATVAWVALRLFGWIAWRGHRRRD